jgi:S-DNA-T family DNA segregation ATPase FtsK/SpoIIIE
VDDMAKKNTFIARVIPACGSILLFIMSLGLSPLLAISTTTLWLLGGISVFTTGEYLLSFLYRSKLDRFFEEASIISKSGKLPQVLSCKKSDSSIEYCVRMPAGLSSEDLEKIKTSMAQYLDATLTISYKNGLVTIFANKEELKSRYEFELIPTAKPLEICLGYSLSGICNLDIEKSPHILVGSETGGGKTTCLKGIITNLILLKNIDLYLIDMQHVGFSIFKKSSKVKNFTSDKIEISRILLELSQESAHRLQLFDKANVDNITDYNKHAKTKLQYKIVIIDEFSALVKEKHIHEQLMLRLSQDRKCGIHYIISTQHPIKEVVDTTIKANIPVRIAFQTTDGITSRVILDDIGAEKLRGRGHGLIKSNGKVTEFQAFDITNEEIIKLISSTFIEKGDVKQIAAAKRSPNFKVY